MRSWWLIAGFLLLVGCSLQGSATEADTSRSREVVVFAASSLTDVFTEVAQAFEAEQPGIEVVLSFAGTSLLRTQLAYGAQADVFASADRRQMELAQATGLVARRAEVFATNTLAVAASEEGSVRELGDLARPGTRLILALPEVPVGAYTQELLDRLSSAPEYGPDFVQRVRDNVVSLEGNVRLVVGKVSLGEADAGVAYVTDVVARKGVRLVAVPPEYGVRAHYLAAVTQQSTSPELAEAFIQFLLSQEGQEVFRRHGFEGPGA